MSLLPASTPQGRKAYAVEPGELEIQLGASSQDIRLTAVCA